MPDFSFELLGDDTDGVRDWEGLQILGTFDNGNVQPNITTGELRFVGPAGRALIAYVDKGAAGTGPGLHVAPDFNISFANPVYALFKGVCDLSSGMVIDRQKGEVTCKIKQLDGLNTFENVAQAITFSLLESKGVYSSSDYVDIPYIKEIEFEFLVAAMLAISVFTITEKTIQLSKDIAKNIAVIAGIIGAGVGGPVSGTIAAALIAILELAYAVSLVILLVKLADDLFAYLLSPIRNHKGIQYYTLLQKAVEFAGYTFSSAIPELKSIYYLPKKTERGKTGSADGTGLPTSGDPIYTLDKAVGLAKSLFAAKIKIVDKKLNIEALNNTAFWKKDSTYTLKNVLVIPEKYNTSELKSTKVIEFETDDRDAFTLENYAGTVYEIKTNLKTEPTDKRKNTLSGIEEIIYPVSLGTRKDELNVTESVLLGFANSIDNVINLFGGNSDYSGRITNRIGMLKMSSDLVAKPKLMLMDNTLHLPPNYRTSWSAKYLYNNYLKHFSFVLNNYQNQYRIFEKIKMDASFADFLKVILSNRCTTEDGKEAEILSFLYYPAKNYWEADYRVKQIWTRNLQETYTETN